MKSSDATAHNFLPRIFWLGALLITLITALLLADTEIRYLHFIESLDDVDVKLFWVQTEETEEKVTLHFEAIFRNVSDLTMNVEALNTQLFVGEEYAGAPSITEGQIPVPPKGEQAVPLLAVLWENRARMFQEARASGQSQLRVVGRARVGIQIGTTSLTVFYDVGGTFPLRGGAQQ